MSDLSLLSSSLRADASSAVAEVARLSSVDGRAVSESDVLECRDSLRSAKHALIDLQTRKSLAASLAGAPADGARDDRNPFAPLDDANRAAVAAKYAGARSEVRAKKDAVEAAQSALVASAEEAAALAVEVAAAAASADALAAELDAAAAARAAAPSTGADASGVLVATLPACGSAALPEARHAVASATAAAALTDALTVEAAMLRSAALADDVARAAADERAAAAAAAAAASVARREALAREHASRAQAVVTQAQRAGEAERYYEALERATMTMLGGGGGV